MDLPVGNIVRPPISEGRGPVRTIRRERTARMYRDVVLENVVALLDVHVRPCVELDGKAIRYAAIAKMFAIFDYSGDDVQPDGSS